ncbi:MAG: hypothetical protein MZV70_77285 [Desulfobacterales bacterium]|nr:hypothetical protein [Desulfobacterales bacterium]
MADRHAAATGQLLYRFFTEQGIAFPPHVAESLYAAIATTTPADSGFRIRLRPCCTSAPTWRRRGPIPQKSTRRYLLRIHTPRSRCSRESGRRLRFCGGKVCWMDMPMALLSELGAPYSDSEGMADCTITAAGVEVGILTKHTGAETHFGH